MSTDGQRLSGRIALITGASRGIGAAVAKRFAAEGAQVILVARTVGGLEEVDDEIRSASGGAAQATLLPLDLMQGEEIDKLASALAERFGRLDVLVNSAGRAERNALGPGATHEEVWDRVIDVNLKGTYMCSRAVLPAMQEGGWGRIVNFSSTAGKNVSTVGGAHYTASKAGVLGFTRHLAKEVARYGIRPLPDTRTTRRPAAIVVPSTCTASIRTTAARRLIW